jgi:hypothetical protein
MSYAPRDRRLRRAGGHRVVPGAIDGVRRGRAEKLMALLGAAVDADREDASSPGPASAPRPLAAPPRPGSPACHRVLLCPGRLPFGYRATARRRRSGALPTTTTIAAASVSSTGLGTSRRFPIRWTLEALSRWATSSAS